MQTLHRSIPALLAFVLLGGFTSAMARPAQTHTRTIDKTEAVTAATRVTVENLVGHVDITQGGKQLAVRATVVAGGKDAAAAAALADTIQLAVSRSGDQLTVHVDYPVDTHDSYRYNPSRSASADDDDDDDDGFSIFGLHIGHFGSSSLKYQGRTVHVYKGDTDHGAPLHVDLAIRLPAGIHATVRNHVGSMRARQLDNTLGLESDNGDIQAHAVHGALNIDTSNGDVRVDDLEGRLDLVTDNGDVDLSGINGPTSVETGNGDIEGHAITGPVKADTGNGDITLEDLQARSPLRINSGRGDIRIEGDLSKLTGFQLESGMGDIDLVTHAPPPVHLDIQTGMGDIDVDWQGLEHVRSDDDSYRADIGAARGTGHIESGMGDVTLSR